MASYSTYSNTALGLQLVYEDRQTSLEGWKMKSVKDHTVPPQIAKLEKETQEIKTFLETPAYKETLERELHDLKVEDERKLHDLEVENERENARTAMRYAIQRCTDRKGRLMFQVMEIGHSRVGRVLAPSIVCPNCWWVALGSDVEDMDSDIVLIGDVNQEITDPESLEEAEDARQIMVYWIQRHLNNGEIHPTFTVSNIYGVGKGRVISKSTVAPGFYWVAHGSDHLNQDSRITRVFREDILTNFDW